MCKIFGSPAAKELNFEDKYISGAILNLLGVHRLRLPYLLSLADIEPLIGLVKMTISTNHFHIGI